MAVIRAAKELSFFVPSRYNWVRPQIMRSKTLKILLIILIIAVFILFNKFGGKAIRNTFYLIFSPFNKTLWRAGEGVANFFGTTFKQRALEKENEELERQNLILLKELSELKTLREENKTLRSALNLGLAESFELFLAEVIAEEKDQGSLLISGGIKKGIFADMPVITQEGVLVGKIKESFSSFSKVVLISHPKNVFDVEIQRDKSVLGVVRGKGNLGIELQLVPKEKELKVGDVVLTTTMGGNFPKGFLVGEIKEVRRSDPEPFQGGTLNPYFTHINLRRVFVITNFERPKQDD